MNPAPLIVIRVGNGYVVLPVDGALPSLIPDAMQVAPSLRTNYLGPSVEAILAAHFEPIKTEAEA